MKALVYHGPGKKSWDTVPNPTIQSPTDVIVKIDVHGAEQMRRKRPEAVYVFIKPPSMDELLRRRIERATETPREIAARQRLAEVEMGFADRYDHVVVNDDAERAVAEIRRIVESQRSTGREPAGTR